MRLQQSNLEPPPMSLHQHSRKRQALSRLLSLSLPNRITRRIFPGIPLIWIDGPSRSKATRHFDTSNVLHVDRVSSCDKRPMIDILPDDVLLHIFYFARVRYLDPTRFSSGLSYYERWQNVDEWRLSWWYPFVRVCRKWRCVVFASPNFLDLKLVCVPGTPMELIGIWPPLPIIIRNQVVFSMPEDYDFDAAIVHADRVCEIDLNLTSSQLQRLSSAMQMQFPALIHLKLSHGVARYGHDRSPVPALPDGFLGGSALHLKSLKLRSIPFPALQKLLGSATDLVHLSLENIPHTGYFSPEVTATALAVLANLESLTIEFESPLSRPDWGSRRPPPLARTVLPALTSFRFQGVSEYLEDLVSRIDAPLLDSISTNFFHQLTFDIPQLVHFLRRTTRLNAFNEARVDLRRFGVSVQFPQTGAFYKVSEFRISCRVLEWQLSSLAQLFTSFFPSNSVVEHLYINTTAILPPQWQDNIDNTQWLEIFQPFTAVKDLYISREFSRCIAPVLQELVGERVADVLPALESLFLQERRTSGPVQEAIGQFVAARQLSGRPLTIFHWDRRGEALLRRF